MFHGQKKRFILFIILIICIGVSGWIIYQNKNLMINEIMIRSEKIPRSFSGYRIAQISDLHNAEFGKDNEILVRKVKESHPDIIVFTGDAIDSYHTNINITLDFVKEVMKIAPCYYVSGNHEARIDELDGFLKSLSNLGVTVLRNESVLLEKNDETISLLGIDDPSFKTDYLFGEEEKLINDILLEQMKQVVGYTILISHRPELFDVYVLNGLDLVLTGHAHGGQLRIPFIGGLIAPGQGLFPKYDEGVYSLNDTHMVVSRGVGNSIIPFRINNRPEIVVIELLAD